MSGIISDVLTISDACAKAYKAEADYHERLMREALDREDFEGVKVHAAAVEFCRFASKQYSEVRTKHQNRNRT